MLCAFISSAERQDHMDLENLWDWRKSKLPAQLMNESGIGVLDEGEDTDLNEDAPVGVRGVRSIAKKKTIPSARPNTTPGMIESQRTTDNSSSLNNSDFALALHNQNINKQHLTPVTRTPFKRRLDKRMQQIKKPRGPGGSRSNIMMNGPSGSGSSRAGTLVRHTRSKREDKRRSNREDSAKLRRRTGGNHTGDGRMGAQGSAFSQTFQPYQGDIFGTQGKYIGGMVYRSRMREDPKMMNRNALQSKKIPNRQQSQDLTALMDLQMEQAKEQEALLLREAAEAREQQQAAAIALANSGSINRLVDDEDEDEDDDDLVVIVVSPA